MRTVVSAIISAAVALMVTSVTAYAGAEDDAIEAAVKESHVFRENLKEDDIRIQSRDGVVTLSGTVSDESHKDLARDTVSSIPGVKGVEAKQLKVLGEPVTRADAWLTAKVKATLLFHRNVDAMTRVDVKDGVVILRGAAASQAQKDLTTEYAKDVRGVKGGRNEMILVTPKTEKPKVEKEVDDASITSIVKMTLMSHTSTSGLGIGVETKNGVVILTGKVKSTAERDLVSKYVNDVVGVKAVDNRLIVEPSP